jgi:GT2 family glycosyltransferase
MLRRFRRPRLTSGGRARRAALEDARALPARPLISVVMPTYETEERYVREAIDSVRAQVYPEWELRIADDGSRRPGLRALLDRCAREDERIEVTYLDENRGISAATNAALAGARGEFVAFLDHDDLLPSDALLRTVQALTADPELDVVYSDSDKLTLHGTLADPFFKPDWSPTYALGAMYIGHLLVVRRSLVEEVGGFDSAFDTIQDFEFMLRVSERTDRIHHIPRILYHWRAIPGSIAAGAEQKQGVPELQARAVSEHLERIGVEVRAVPHGAIPHRAELAARDGDAPGTGPGESASIVIPWRGEPTALSRLVDSLLASSPSPGELIVVAPDGADVPERIAGSVVVVAGGGGLFSRSRAANLGAARARGDWLIFCSDAAEAVEPDWLARLMLCTRLPRVVAVGPLLARPDGRTEAAGVAVGLDHPALPMLAGLESEADGYYGSLVCARDVSALCGDFLCLQRAAFEAAGGFEENYATGYEDFDLCQRLRSLGGGVVYAARPRVVVHETAASRREALDVVDRALFVDRWYEALESGDPFYNPNFLRDRAAFAVA